MKSGTFKGTLAVLTLAMLVMAATPAGAALIVSESFETPVAAADGEKITAAIGPAGFYRMGSDRVFRHSEVFGSLTTPYGDQALGTFRNEAMNTASNAHGIVTTLITDVLEVATEYTLTFNAGNARAGYTTATTNVGATAQLLAGSTVLDMVTVVTTTNDMSQSGSITFTTGLDHPSIGETLGIRFFQTLGGNYRWHAVFDNVQLEATGATPILSTGATSDWNATTTWNPATIPTDTDLVKVQSGHQVNSTGGADVAKWLKVEGGSSKVTVDNGAALSAFDVLATTGGALDVIGTLTSTGSVAVHSGSSMDVTGILIAPVLNSSGTVTIGAAATTTGVVQTNLIGGSITGAGALSLGAVDVQGGTLNAGGTVTTTALTYNSGTLNLGGNNLNANVLTVNGNLNVSGSTVTAATAISLNNATLTIGHDIGTQTYTRDGGSIVGGVVTADTKYSLANIADYTDDITGATAELVIGEAVTNGVVKLSGTGNTYGGSTTITSGVLEVSPDAANLGSGQLVFNGGVLRTSGTFTGQLGAANDIDHSGNFGFAATDAPLTVTLLRADGSTTEGLQFSYQGNQENGASTITLGSTTSDAQVELTNGLFAGHGAVGGGGQSYHVKLKTIDNPNSSTDIGLVSGNITNPADENQVSLEKTGPGTLWLTGTNTGFAKTTIGGGNQSVLRAVDGVGLSPTALLQFNQGVLESSGTFTREFGNTAGNGVDPGMIDFNKEGGFSAYGAPLTVSLTPAGGAAGDPLDWKSRTAGFNNKHLYMGSATADNVVTITNDITGPGGNYNKNIYVSGNPDSDADYVVFSGAIGDESNGLREIRVDGTANPGEVRFTGDVKLAYYLYASKGATVSIDGTMTSSAGNYGVRAQTGGRLSGTGVVSQLRADNSGGIVAPGNGVGTLTVTGNTLMQDNSIYEWQVGQDGETDVLNVTGAGTLDLDKFIFKILDADGYVADAANQLPVFTYENGVTTVQEQLADVTFDTSALDAGMWDWSAGLALTDDAGIIYLTGLTGGASVEVLWGGDLTGNWANADKWLPVGTPAGTSAAVVDTADAVVSVAAGANARSLDVKQGTVDVQTGVVLGAGNSVSVGTAGTVNVDGTLNASAGNVAGTLGGDGTIDVDTIDVAATGTLNVNGTLNAVTGSVAGTLAGTGTINVGVDSSIEVTGTVAPGGATGVGTLTLGTGKMVLNPAATFNAQVSLASVGPDQVVADQITVSAGNLLMLGGTLAVSGLGDRADSESWADATPTVVLNNGDIGEVGVGGYEFSGVTPQPDPDNPPHLGQGAFLRDVTYESRFDPIVDAVKLDVFVALGGDADGDAKVWLSDWAVLRANFGNTATGKTWTDGNFDSWVDGKVWLSDWAALRANFGNADYTVAEAGASAVPEPGTIAMLLAALGGITIVLRRARASNRPI